MNVVVALVGVEFAGRIRAWLYVPVDVGAVAGAGLVRAQGTVVAGEGSDHVGEAALPFRVQLVDVPGERDVLAAPAAPDTERDRYSLGGPEGTADSLPGEEYESAQRLAAVRTAAFRASMGASVGIRAEA